MYDLFHITDNRNVERTTWTEYYYLAPPDVEIDRKARVSKYFKGPSIIYTNANGTDSHYLLPRHDQVISNSSICIPTDREISDCFDIVFLSNGEECAEENYERLLSLKLPNRIHRVSNVVGRNAAYKEAARVSTTRYFFAVFAKLEINPEFDFSFGAREYDYRHYIFHAHNPVNDLVYGHQAMILYNKDQVLANPGNQIDFTMAQMYREIPLLSGVARYNFSPKGAWRTAFREVLKLELFNDKASQSRIEAWLTGTGEYSEYSIQGARDAVEYFKTHSSNMDMLLKSYDWEWLDNYFQKR